MLEDSIIALATSPWVYVGVFTFALIDGFFPPIPSESLVISLAALSVSTGRPILALLIPTAALGAFAGDQVAFQIGTAVDLRTIRLFRGTRGRAALAWAEQTLADRGSSFILAARYIPVGRVAVNMSAGSLGFSRRRFVGLAALAALAWAIYGTAIGVGAGVWLHRYPFVAVLAGVVVGTVAGVVVDVGLRRFQSSNRRSRSDRADAVGPHEHGGSSSPAASDRVGERACDRRRIPVRPESLS